MHIFSNLTYYNYAQQNYAQLKNAKSEICLFSLFCLFCVLIYANHWASGRGFLVWHFYFLHVDGGFWIALPESHAKSIVSLSHIPYVVKPVRS